MDWVAGLDLYQSLGGPVDLLTVDHMIRISKGVSLNVASVGGQTILHILAAQKSSLYTELSKRFPQLHVRDLNGQTPTGPDLIDIIVYPCIYTETKVCKPEKTPITYVSDLLSHSTKEDQRQRELVAGRLQAQEAARQAAAEQVQHRLDAVERESLVNLTSQIPSDPVEIMLLRLQARVFYTPLTQRLDAAWSDIRSLLNSFPHTSYTGC